MIVVCKIIIPKKTDDIEIKRKNTAKRKENIKAETLKKKTEIIVEEKKEGAVKRM